MKAFGANSLRAEKKQRAIMPSIPQEIQEDILLRLPVKSILCFKSVCKSWYTLLSSPKFINDHLILNKQKPRLMIIDSSHMENIFYSILSASASLSSTPCKCEGAVVMDDPVKELNAIECRDITILGSCNGLLCLAVNLMSTVLFWNPSSKEYKDITPPICDLCCSYGFGYDSKSKDYKLVCVEGTDVYVYSLESESWRKATTIPCKDFHQPGGLLLNGAIHWSASEAIVAFDVSGETFMNFPFPATRVLGDSLCLVCGDAGVGVDVWVMQNYGVTNSWTKRFTTTQVSITRYPRMTKLYWSFKNGEILMQFGLDTFSLYDEKNERFRLLSFNGISSGHRFTSVSYMESLVSLNSGTYTGKRRC